MSIANHLKVLLVDDHRTSRMLLRAALEQLGIKQIVFACDGEEALKAMMQTPCHIIISDFNMPDMDGLQFLEQVRGDPVIGKTVFIMLTGSADKEIVQKAAALGVNNYVVKPFAPAALKEKIERVFGELT